MHALGRGQKESASKRRMRITPIQYNHAGCTATSSGILNQVKRRQRTTLQAAGYYYKIKPIGWRNSCIIEIRMMTGSSKF